MKEDSETTKTIVQLFLQYLTQRELEKLVQLFSENIQWHIPGNEKLAPWLGKRSSRKEVKEFYELLWENTEPKSAEIRNILVDGQNAILSGIFSTRMLKTNKIVDSMFFIEMVVENNLIIDYRLLEDSFAVSESLTD